MNTKTQPRVRLRKNENKEHASSLLIGYLNLLTQFYREYEYIILPILIISVISLTFTVLMQVNGYNSVYYYNSPLITGGGVN